MGRSATMAGPQVVETFLEELAQYVRCHPDRSIDGTPQEIVEEVVSRSSRFGTCRDESIDNLRHQLVMAVRSKGRRLRLGCEPLQRGRVRVVYAS